MAERSPSCWYRLRSGVLYHAVGDPPAGSVPVSVDELEQLVDSAEDLDAVSTEVAGDELGTDGEQLGTSPGTVVEAGDGDDEVDDGEGT